MAKQRDWIVVNIDNPDFTPTDFKIVGLTAADTQLQPFDNYLSNPIVTDDIRFKDDNGNFSKDKFKKFYDLAALGYLKFSLDYDTFKYDLFDPKRKLDSEIENPNFELTQESNPSHLTMGIRGRNLVGESEYSLKELAQLSKVFDPITGTYSETSLDDLSLFKNPVAWVKNLFSDPIVYATYDSDDTHIDPISGREVAHKKGEFRVNEEGEYFTEKLGGRNIRDKEVVSVFDLITSDTSGINDYDFFDSDGLDKSITASLFSTAASIAPLFNPTTGLIYSSALVARELVKTIPMISGMIDSVLGTDLLNSSVLNSISGYASKFLQGTSLHSKEKAFTFENLSNLVSEVATQWGQQKIIAKGINKLTKADKLIEEATSNARKYYLSEAIGISGPILNAIKTKAITAEEGANRLVKAIGIDDINKLNEALVTGKWAESAVGKAAVNKFVDPVKSTVQSLNQIGADVSLGYMAIISNTDVYNDLIDSGVTKGEAALFAFGSTLGMFGVDKYIKLGELFFDELKTSDKYIKNNISEMLEPWKKDFQSGSTQKVVGKNRIQKIINSGREFGKEYVGKYLSLFGEDLKYHTTGFLGKAAGEALEESAEELVTDMFKQLYEVLGQMGITSLKDVGAFKDWQTRYGMSFLGGALGGGMFYGVGAYQGHYPVSSSNEDILYHIRNGKTDEYLKRIDQWEREGKFGRTDLSATQYTEARDADGQVIKDEDGNILKIYLSTTNQDDSQNHFIAERVRNGIKLLDAIIHGNKLGLTDEELFENMVMSEQRYVDFKDWLGKQSYALNYHETYQNLARDIVNIELQILEAENTDDGTILGDVETDKLQREARDTELELLKKDNLDELRNRKRELISQRDLFLSADTSYYYTRKMLFALDPIINSYFFPTSYEQWLKDNKNGVSDDLLNESDREKYRKEYEEWKKTKYKSELDAAFQKYLDVEKLVSPAISELNLSNDDYIRNYEIINKLLENVTVWIPDDKGLEESDEDYQKYKEISKKPIKTKEDFIFLKERENRINEYNKAKQEEIIALLDLLTKKLDPLSYRLLKRKTGILELDRLDAVIQAAIEPYFRNEWKEENQGPVESKESYNYYLSIKDNEHLTPEQVDFIASRKVAVENYNAKISFLSRDEQVDSITSDLRTAIVKILVNPDLSKEEKYNSINDSINESISKIKEGVRSKFDQAIVSPLNNIINRLYNGYLSTVADADTEEKINLTRNHAYVTLVNNTVNLEVLAGINNELINLINGLSEENKREALEVFNNLSKDYFTNIFKIVDIINRENPDFYVDISNLFKLTNYDEDDPYPYDVQNLTYGNAKVIAQELLNNKELYDLSNSEIKELELVLNAPVTAPDTIIDDDIKVLLKEEIENKAHLNPGNIQKILDEVNKIINNVDTAINSDRDYQFIKKLKGYALYENPLFKFIGQITKALGIEDLEEELQQIDLKISTIKGINEFTLNDPLIEKFNKLKDVLLLAQGYLYSASAVPGILQPYGHNGTVNLLIKNNPSITTKIELPLIDQRTFLMYGLEIEKYLLEIEKLEELHNNNSVNKAKRFRTTKLNFAKVQGKLLETIRPLLKFTIEGKEVDLLKGVETIGFTDKPQIRNKLIAELFHKNFINLTEKYSIELILSSSKLLEKLIAADTVRQLVSKLDERINYDTFTNYDKLVNVLSWLSLDEREWEEYLKEDIKQLENIVPLTIQQHAARIAASVLSSNIFRDAIKYIKDNNLIDLSYLPVLEKTVFIPGVAGAGKSQVTARQTVNFIASKFGITPEQILIAGSTHKIRTNLRSAIGTGTIIDLDTATPRNLTIFEQFLPKELYNKIMNEVDTINKDKPSGEYVSYKNVNNNDILILNWDAIKDSISEEERPEVIVVDEATHFSSIQLLLFDKIAKRGVVLLGDGSQSGYSNVGGNLSFEQTFMWRTPKLGISLRDNNLLNLENQIFLADLLEQIRNLPENTPSYLLDAQFYLDILNNLRFRGHLRTGLNGTVFSPEINDDLISKILDKNAEVAFVGSENSSTYLKLNAASGRMKSLTVFKDVESILGQEFDYVIVDSDFAKEELSKARAISNIKGKLYYKYLAILKLYTLISRAKVGSLFINPSPEFGESIIEKSSAMAKPLGKAMEDFRVEEILDIDEYLTSKVNVEVSKKATTTTKDEDEDENEDEDGGDDDDDDDDDDKGPEIVIKDGPTSEVPEPEIDDDDQEVIERSEDPSIPSNIPVYTFITVLGAERGWKKHKGKMYPIWKAPASRTGPIRDMEIFLKEDLTIDTAGIEEYYKLRTFNELLLRYLVHALSHKKSWDSVYVRLGDYLTLEEYEGLMNNIFLVRRPPINPRTENRDLRINYIPDADKGEIKDNGESSANKNPVVITSEVKLVAKYKNITVTLGLPLSNEVAVSKELEFRSKLEATRNEDNNLLTNNSDLTDDERKELEDRIREIDKRLSTLEADTKKYVDYINSLKVDDPVRVEFDPTFTSLRVLKQGMLLSKARKNTGVVMSKPLIYIGDTPFINSKMKGRPVVLVSSDLTKRSDLLMQLYIDDIKAGRRSEIRMINLSTRGVHVIDLINRHNSLIFGKEVKGELAVAWEELGIKMIGSLWNFRANLLQFQKEYENFLTSNGLTDLQVIDVLSALLVEYENGKPGATIQPVPDYDKNIAAKIQLFNDSLSNKVRQFRLGSRTKGGLPSQFIGRIAKDKFYSDSEPFGIYIHPTQVTNFITILNTYFKILKDNNILSFDSLDPKEVIGQKIGEKIKYKDIKKSLKKVIKAGEGDNWSIEGVQINGNRKAFGVAALLTFRMYAKAHFELEEPGSSNTYITNNNLNITLSKGTESEKTIDVSQLISDLIFNTNDSSTFRNMFLLAMHGTTESRENFGTILKSSDAYFTRGIFLHARKDKNNNLYNGWFMNTVLSDEMFEVDVYPSGPTLQVKVYREGTEKKEKKKKKEVLTLQKVLENKTISKLFGSEIDKKVLLNLINPIISSDDSLTIELVKEKIIQSVQKSYDVLSLDMLYYDTESDKIVTLLDYVKSKYKISDKYNVVSNSEEIKISNEDGSGVEIELSDSKTDIIFNKVTTYKSSDSIDELNNYANTINSIILVMHDINPACEISQVLTRNKDEDVNVNAFKSEILLAVDEIISATSGLNGRKYRSREEFIEELGNPENPANALTDLRNQIDNSCNNI